MFWAILLVSSPSGVCFAADREADSEVVASVNGTVITRRSVDDVVAGLLTLRASEPDPGTRERYAGEALESLIDLELLYQESQRREVSVPDEAVDAEVGRTKRHFASEKAYAEALRAKGLSEADVRSETRRTMAVNRLLEGTVWKDIRIPPEEVTEFYQRHREEFRHPAEIRASHILIRLPRSPTPAQRRAAQNKAESILARLRAGADFAELARTDSDDPDSASRGGDLGYFSKGEFDADFEAAAFALAPGATSGLVKTGFGLHVIKITARRDAGVSPLEEVDDRIRSVLVKRERQRRQTEVVAELRKQAKIEYAATEPAGATPGAR